MVYVFDASFVGAAIIPDEKTPQFKKLYDKINNEDDRYTPNLLWYEVASMFKNLSRRKRYTLEEVKNFFQLLSDLNLSTDFEHGSNYSKKIWELCNKYNLSPYDAAYLELADRKKATLCTLDENLTSAAKTHGVKTIR